MKDINDMLKSEVKERPEVCEKHGPFTSKNILGLVWTKCSKCENERREQEAVEEARKKREADEAAWQARLGAVGIPDRFRDRTLDTYIATEPKQKRVLEFARAYADNFADVKRTGQSLMFIGLPGTGKNHLAAGIALQVMREHSVLFTTLLRAVRRVKDTWTSKTETETQAIESLVFPSLLILDEVGVQFGSDTEKLILFDVLNERYEKRKPTILLSNLTLDEVRAYLGERIFDRLREDGGKFFVFDWQSYRGRKLSH